MPPEPLPADDAEDDAPDVRNDPVDDDGSDPPNEEEHP